MEYRYLPCIYLFMVLSSVYNQSVEE